MRIDYKNYVVYPYTLEYLRKNYSSEVISRFGDQLSYLYQNGYEISGNHSLNSVREQLELFNCFENTEDFEDAIQGLELKEPSKAGYKIFDSLLEIVIKESSWAVKKFEDVLSFGKRYFESIVKYCGILSLLEKSEDIEIRLVFDKVIDEDFLELLKRCNKYCDSEKYGIALIVYQELYNKVIKIHQKILSKTGAPNKGEIVKIGNINDELYGSSGNYNPNSDKINAYYGSLAYELKALAAADTDMNFMVVFARDCKADGENDKTILDFISGDRSKMDEVKKILVNICFNGVITLLGLKYDITSGFKDEIDNKRFENFENELEAICKYASVNLKSIE